MNYLRQHGEIFLLIIAVITAALLGSSQLFPDQSVPQKIFLGAGLVFWIVTFEP